MARVLYIPTGIVFEVPDIYYFETLFTTDPTLFYHTKSTMAILYMSSIIDLIDEADDTFFPNNASYSYYVTAVEFIQKLGRECFEIL
jgi:hypothetical protein